MTDHHRGHDDPTQPVLAGIEPVVPGGLYGDQSYEAALSDLRAATADISAALEDAEPAVAAQLALYRRQLGQTQLQLRADDAPGMEAAHALCRTVRRYLDSGRA
ncbi:hypothetical protein [Streptomyces longispororuber]|uniref:hypothetical protein n=1 Tax=Streptomyces longispororuber TaxID=68230 RepID=UPI0037011459